jgi:hypothetical protein
MWCSGESAHYSYFIIIYLIFFLKETKGIFTMWILLPIIYDSSITFVYLHNLLADVCSSTDKVERNIFNCIIFVYFYSSVMD